MPETPHARPARVAVAAACAAVLASCGFNPATNEINTIGAGVNDRSGPVEVLRAVVIAGEPDVGVFAASLVNSTDRPVEFLGLRPTAEVDELGDAPTARVGARDLVNLFGTGGVEVEGDFRAGDFVDVEVAFDTGQVTRLEVPVVTPCRQYSPLALPALELPGRDDELVRPTEAVEGDRDPELGEGPGAYTCEIEPLILD